MGPTASGKTSLAVDLVQQHPFQIVSVDSAQIYRQMDIGTGKPQKGVLDIAPHRLIDFIDPAVPYSASQFRADAYREIDEILDAGATPAACWRHDVVFSRLARRPRKHASCRSSNTC